ncbi:hypothetical protein J4450_01030 [Candidatus Micrarchaeota archaeon]|nr:hypothetical protein [Candidatus Micrarchaeota archaeon]
MHAVAVSVPMALRQKEAGEIAALLRKGKHVKIVGLDKTGKTTLLRALAEELKDKSPLLDNVAGNLDYRTLSRARAGVLLIDEAITFCNFQHSGADRIVYTNQIKRLIANGARVVFALHKAPDVEAVFDEHFPGTERYLLNAQLSLEEARDRIHTINLDGFVIHLSDQVVSRLLELSGGSAYFIDQVFSTLRESPELDDSSIVRAISRKPCQWIARLSQSEIALLKLVLGSKDVDLVTYGAAIRELVGLGIIESQDSRLVIPGLAVRANLGRTIMLMDDAV